MKLPLQAFAMFSAARAFTAPTRTTRYAFARSASSRLFSTTLDGSGPDRTVVGTCTEKIKQALNTDTVTVEGAYDDPNGSHISIKVVSEQFEGKRAVQRQQMVYKAIWEEMQGAVHAVDAMECKAPSEV